MMPRMSCAELHAVQQQVRSPSAGFQAKGRLPVGTMNKTETAYAAYLETLRHAGEVLWWKFEGIKLRLAGNTFLTVDFAILRKDQVLIMADVKGSAAIFTDDAKVKMKVAAEAFPFVFVVVVPTKSGGWEEHLL
ncbi:hypothetical protein [Roseomonas xinghualingensis]|uniref:hypothetical protein n=1 Tax=Roseomonas xinghualingensis TaxID=2986475 RepID=UPI0021F0DD59|nr:hypothetical protein [Roseomonas sp. SXEYE001]MCV4207550.1 hypothetical protein [Roseomonas sp. SXEYE001]